MTVIPLDWITGVRTTKSPGIVGWWGFQTLVVTTAGGTEYGFSGKMGNWQAYLTSALAVHGREVRRTVEGITIMPWRARSCPGGRANTADRHQRMRRPISLTE